MRFDFQANAAHWYPGEPQGGHVENCCVVNFASDGTAWVDVKCDLNGHFICERPA